MKNILCTLLCLCHLFAYSQHYNLYAGGAYARGLAGQSVLPDDINAVYFNPAAMANAHLPRQGLDCSVSEVPGLSGWLVPSIGAKVSIRQSHFGIYVCRMGKDGFSMLETGLGYARALNKNVWMGIRFKQRSLSIREYGSKILPGVEAGFITRINHKSSLGLTWSQSLSAVIETNHFNPGKLAAGYQYDAGKALKLIVEIEKEEAYPLSPKVGFIYKPVTGFEWRAGVELSRRIIGTAFGIEIRRLHLSMGYEWHQVLKGGFSMGFQWRK